MGILEDNRRRMKAKQRAPVDAVRYLVNKESLSAQTRTTRMAIKQRVFNHYGVVCKLCGAECDLTIDHENQDGAEHRKTLPGKGLGISIYRWLVKSNFPPGFRTLCRSCNTGEGNKYRAASKV